MSAVRRAWPRTARERRRTAVLAAVLVALAPLAWRTWRAVDGEWTGVVAVPAPVERHRSTHLATGWEIVLEPGRAGESRVRVRTRSRAGRVMRVDREVLAVLRAPRPERRLVGAARAANPVGAPRLTRAIQTHRVLATAYDPGPEDNGAAWTGTTKLGWRARRGIVAVDPAVIPLRSLLYVEGYGLAWAGDTGGAIRGWHLDLCFNSTAEADGWGKRHVTVWVLSAAP